MLLQHLHITDVALQRVPRVDAARAGDAVHQLHRFGRTAGGGRRGQQQVCPLREGGSLACEGPLPRLTQGGIEERARRVPSACASFACVVARSRSTVAAPNGALL